MAHKLYAVCVCVYVCGARECYSNGGGGGLTPGRPSYYEMPYTYSNILMLKA